MQKIKFKIEYKPLSEKAINQYKNFDGLMAMYAAIPKPNLFQRIFKNRWTMFSGGIIIGSAITALIALNSGNHSTGNITFNQQPATVQVEKQNTISVEPITENTQTLSAQNHLQETDQNTGSEVSTPAQTKTESPASNKLNNENKNDIVLGDVNENRNSGEADNYTIEAQETNVKLSIEPNLLSAFTGKITNDADATDPFVENNEIINTNSEILVYELPDAKKEQEILSSIDNKSDKNTASSETSQSENKKNEKKSIVKENEHDVKGKSEKNKNDLVPATNNDNSDKITILDKIFDKAGEQEISAEINPDTTSKANDPYINRYAQLSFFTPLGTNGIDSYKYRHYISFNIIEGFNGAVNGAEFGGVLNLDKGYMTGGQFAGVANLVGGDVKGFQGAGVMNISKTVTGFQGAGVVNTVEGNMTGVQGAGVMNIAVKKLNGFQAAGVLNINTSTDTSAFWQAAGVANFSVAHSTGAQTAGVLNIANDHTGAQIGLINFSKKIKGTQIGLINIADSIDGAAIGLLSFSSNGIFDIDISTNDFMPLNAAVRVGGPLIYNIFTFGITPSADTATYAYGIGIGGEIPFDKFYVDIDAIGWNVHKDKFEFNYEYFHMNNQLRVTPGYKINKYISVYAGPVVNVEIYDNAIVPLHTNPIREIAGSAFTTNISAGYVAGIRFF